MSQVSLTADRRASRVSFAQSIASSSIASSRPGSRIAEDSVKNAHCELLLCKMLARGGGLEVSDRRSLTLRNVRSCISGSELVNWLTAEIGFETRAEARLLALKVQDSVRRDGALLSCSSGPCSR